VPAQILKVARRLAPTHATLPGDDIITGNLKFTELKLKGQTALTQDREEPIKLRAGKSFVLRVGLRCIWDVKEKILKEFAIRG
jgi:hypothetical protein